MKSLVVGTAGHIDHGKTALVKALTGIDADRLEEEKRRGITIDLGFAHLTLKGEGGEAIQIGFVDVPGHERFVRNMLAGAGGIDLALFVIAADESIKPQSREHFEILRLLGIPSGITVITKSDNVDAETLGVVRMEIEEFLRGSFLEAAPIVAVSSRTGDGIQPLKDELVRLSERAKPRDASALTRLPIDRVFTMKGFGTVVTGTLLSGTIRVEDELEVHPSATRVRVRGVQVHSESAKEAVAGQRTALNLAGVDKRELFRGMVLASAGVLHSTRTFDARLEMLPGAKLKKRMKAHLHAQTFEALAEIVAMPAHEDRRNRLARIKLPKAMLLVPGDRFILRQESPLLTIGGGVVLENAPPRSMTANYMDALEAHDGSPANLLRGQVTAAGAGGLTMADAVARTGLSARRVDSLLRELPVIHKFGNTLATDFAVDGVRRSLLTMIETFHKEHPLARGIGREELRGRMAGVSGEVFDGVLTTLLAEKLLETTGEIIWRAGSGVVLKDEEAAAKKRIEQAFHTSGLQVPALVEVLAGLKIDKVRAEKLVTLLLREKTLIKVSAELVFHRTALEQLRSMLSERRASAPRIDVAAFKEMTGVSRKYAIPLLEYLDRERVTRRNGDVREIL